jgi:hypothetical protein
MSERSDRSKRTRLNAFQSAALNKLRTVFVKHGLSVDFVVKEGQHPTVWTTFKYRDDEYTLAVFDREINLQQGPNLYECFLMSEFTDDATLVASFARRLDHFLNGGDWDTSDH